MMSTYIVFDKHLSFIISSIWQQTHTTENFLHHLTTHKLCHLKGNLMHAVFVLIGQFKQDQWEVIGVCINVMQNVDGGNAAATQKH